MPKYIFGYSHHPFHLSLSFSVACSQCKVCVARTAPMYGFQFAPSDANFLPNWKDKLFHLVLFLARNSFRCSPRRGSTRSEEVTRQECKWKESRIRDRPEETEN